MASNVRLFLLLLTICTVAGVQTAEQRQAPAAAPDSCGLIDPRLVSNTTCNGSCRTAIHGALVDIYNNLKGFNWSWGNLEDHAELRTPAAAVWRPDSSECVSCTLQSGEVAPSYCCWEGAVCCGEHHNYIGELGEVTCQPYSVVLLQLRSGNVAGNLGSIMPQLQLLHAHGMAYLDLSRNSITGAIPEAIGSLNKLHVLMLGSNYISGTVPASFSRLNKLSLLDLEFNFLQGSLSPQQLCPAGNVLQAVYLRANNFTGSLNLTACRRLEVADIQENGFTGPLPIGRTNRQLAVLRARLNDFSGTIPIDVWELPQLMTFDVTNNSLSGSLPQNGSPSVFLTNLYLGSNNLSGQVPRGMSESSQLSKLDLSDNFMLTGTLPEMKWMQGLQQLSISNTLISGTIPEALSQLPYLESVDMHNTLMTCCGNWSDVQSRTPAQLLPAFLTFDADLKRSPSNEMLGHNPLLNAYMNTGQNMLCDSVRRDPGHQTVSTSLVLRPANLSRQAWSVDPEYFWFQRCACINGYTARYQNSAAAVWCNSSLHPPGSAAAQRCIEMRVLTCVKKPPLAKEEIAGVAVGAAALLLLLVMLTSLSLNMCMARTGKIRRQLNWWHKHLAGMPRSGKMAIVITDIEGYSDLFKRCPELMYRALTLHNNVIRRAKYANCGSTVQQEGDSYTLVFHDAFDAVAFCLQAQLALMEVQWPEGLMEADSSSHMQMRTASKARRPKLPQLDSLLTGGTSGWLRKSRPNIKAASSFGMHAQSTDSLQAAAAAGGAAGAGPSVLSVRHSGRSRSRMLDYFRGHQGLAGGAGMFNGLRVRMGVVTGVVEGPAEPGAALANIMNSSLYKLALDVSDAGNGGQILMDEATFARIKEELHPLGAVDANGLNYDKLAQRTSLWQLLCLGTLCSSRRHDMLDADEAVVLDMGQYEVPAPPQKVASMRNANASLRQSLKIVWPQMLTQPHAADLPASSGLQESGGGLQESGGLQDGYLLQPTSSLPGAVPLACSSYGYGQQQQQQQQQQQRGSAGGADASGNAPLTARQRVRLVQILAPSLVGRAAVWGNQLSLKSSWVCCDAPYYEAPGAVEAPLGNAVAGRTNSLGAAAAAAGAAASSSPQLQLQQQLDTSTATGSAGLSPTASLSLGAADAAAAAATDTAGDAPKHNFAVAAFASVDSEQQAMLCISSPAAAAAGAASSYWHHNAPQQQQLLGRQLAPPMPPVTMVFLVVEGAKVFGKGRRPLVKEVHAQLAALLVEALKHTQGGYLCRMQEGDLKYMVAFSSARSALEWCLLVQEAALYLHWPDKSFARIPQLRSEYDAEGQLVFRGPRLKMGVCEGVPRTIIPDHLGRADYHGSSINQAARYMDAGAHGGQIACEAELAAAVFAEWAHSGSSSSNATPGGSSAADEEGASMDPAVVRTASAPVAAAGGGAAAAGSGLEADCMLLDGAGGSAELDGGCGAAGAGGPPVLRSNTSRSLDSGLAQLRSTGSSEAAQQQQQQGAAAGAAGCVRCTCSASCAADSMGASGCNCGAAAAAAAAAECGRAEHAGSMGSPFAMSADAAAIAAGAAAGVPAGSANAVPDCTAAAAVQPALSGECSTTSSKESGTAAAAAAAGGSGSGLGSRLSRLFVKSSSTRSRLGYSSTDIKQQELQLAAAATDEQHTAAAAAAAAVSKVAFAGGPGHQSTAAAAPPPSAAPRFGLSEVPRVPVAVSAHHLGSFRFKGNPQPLQMVNVMAASLAGRAALFPADPPKGKGNRVAAGEGLAGSAVAQLPTLALQYRARVPHHVLELVPATPLAGAVGAADPKGLLRGQLRTASMPVTRSRTMMAGLRWGAGSPVDDAAQQQQQQDVEGGLGFGIGLLRLPSSRASSSGRSLSFLMQQRHTPSIPEEPGWDAAAAGKDVGATAAAAAGYADACGVDVRSSTSSNGSGGWASSLGGLFGAGGSHGSKARLAQSLRSQSAIVSRTSSSGGGCESAGVGPFGRSSGSAPHSQRPSASNGADVVIPLAVLREQHSAAAPDAA